VGPRAVLDAEPKCTKIKFAQYTSYRLPVPNSIEIIYSFLKYNMRTDGRDRHIMRSFNKVRARDSSRDSVQ
jgi:hypothetical protein